MHHRAQVNARTWERRAAWFVVTVLCMLLPQPVAADASSLLFADRATLTGQQSVQVTFDHPGAYRLHDEAARAADLDGAAHLDQALPVVGTDRVHEPGARLALLPEAFAIPPITSSPPPVLVIQAPTEHLTAPWSPPPR